MTYNKVIDYLEKNYDIDFTCSLPECTSEKAMNILIEFILGKKWCVTMPVHNDAVICEALVDILYKYSNK